MKQKKLFIAISIGVIAILIGGFIFLKSQLLDVSTATTYEDEGGWIYTCSQPIPVKDQGVKYGNGEPSLTPINKTDVEKYCRRGGIE